METIYSSEDISSSKGLQVYTYMFTSMATFWTYDYICMVDKELMFLAHSRWTKVKCLYIVTRYIPFVLFIAHLYTNFIPQQSPDQCRLLNAICEVFSLISVICSESFFILRTYALWNKSKTVLVIVTGSAAAVIVACISVLFTTSTPFRTSGIPGITGCYQTAGTAELWIPFLLLFVFELGLIILTLLRAIQNWRTSRSPLYSVLVKHNIFYYMCGLIFSVVNIHTTMLLQYAYSALFQNLQFIILAILATRMHLHLWHSDRHRRDPEATISINIPLSDVLPAYHVT